MLDPLPKSIGHLRGLLREIVAQRAISASPRRLTLDFDGPVNTTKARKGSIQLDLLAHAVGRALQMCAAPPRIGRSQ